VDLDGIIGDIQRGKYEFDTHGEPLRATAKLSSVWHQPWPSDSDDHPQLHVYITLPADTGSPTLSDTTGEYSSFYPRSGHLMNTHTSAFGRLRLVKGIPLKTLGKEGSRGKSFPKGEGHRRAFY
jgi:hypothetical protein